jgi:hypothetical protein
MMNKEDIKKKHKRGQEKKPFVKPDYLGLWQQPELTEEEKENLRAHIKSEEERFKCMRENFKKNRAEFNFGNKNKNTTKDNK